MSRRERRPSRLKFATLAAAATVVLAACVEEPTTPSNDPPTAGGHFAGLVEIRFQHLGKPNLTSSALVASSMQELDSLRDARDRAEARGETFVQELRVPVNQDGSTNATIQVDSF